MNNPFSTLTKKEWLLWLGSLFIVLVSNILAANFDPLTLVAALVGVTSLVFAAKGNVWAQVLMIVFSILYGIISFRFRYWGEMITYLGMALPMAVWSAITWLRHPAESGDAVAQLRCGHGAVLPHFGRTGHAKSCFQHPLCHHQLPCDGTDHAAVIILCFRVCRQ